MKGQPFKKFLGIVKQFAPTVLAATGNPLGAALVRRALGGGEADDVEKLVEEHSMTPEGVEKLRLAEIELQKFESEKGIKFAELDNADRADARARQVALKDNMPAHVFYLTTAGFFGTLGYMLLYGLPQNGGEALLLMIGSLGAAWGASVTYFVGSSSGSRQKTELLGGK